MTDRHPAPGPVLVVGDVMVDVVASHTEAIATGSDTAATIRLHGGGSAANTAAWLAVLGDRAQLLAAVGGDDLGGRVVAELEAAGVA
ncbi:MAG TPA: PfkB family carbohydrate kinase, partial [Aquihabitans sp.]|nr:PfkB family carbohydrate kinase [Aquihabitans sp.]